MSTLSVSSPVSSRASTRVPGIVCLLLVGLVAGLLAATLAPEPAQAAQTGPSSRVRGVIVGAAHQGAPKVKVSWFTRDYTYLGSRKAYGGAYSLALRPGTYHLVFEDQRPSYDVSKYQPTDVLVRVGSGRTSVKNVRMRRGGSIGGTVRAGGRLGAGARVVAANADERSYETTANSRGQYALGGLPPGRYSIFTYDRGQTWVGKSVYLRKVSSGSYRQVNPRLTKRAGSLLVDLYKGQSSYGGKVYVTAVSLASGQFWTARATRGSVTFRGLYPGRYKLVVPGSGSYLGETLKLRGRVKPNRVTFSSARLTKQGGSVQGRVVDAQDPSYVLAGAIVGLYDAAGNELSTATSRSDGRFTLTGPLQTQRGLTVSVAAPDSGYLGTEPRRCRYASARVRPVAVTTGRVTDVGDVALRSSDAKCQATARTRTGSDARRTSSPVSQARAAGLASILTPSRPAERSRAEHSMS